jgi:transcriptional regulator with XRE-family HTH domain
MNRIGILRRQKRMTQRQLGQQIGRDQSWVSALETFKMPEPVIKPDVRERLETIFGEPISDQNAERLGRLKTEAF